MFFVFVFVLFVLFVCGFFNISLTHTHARSGKRDCFFSDSSDIRPSSVFIYFDVLSQSTPVIQFIEGRKCFI